MKRNNAVSQSQFGLFGQYKANDEGVAIYNWSYDKYGKPIDRKPTTVSMSSPWKTGKAQLDLSGSMMTGGNPLKTSRFSRKKLPESLTK